MSKGHDFAGWVTKNDILCSDGVTIKHGAFAGSDNKRVPLVWQHDYNSPSNVLGSIELHHRDEGVYGLGYFNDTDTALDAKKLLQHGDLNAMSIGAKGIRKNGNDVIHGEIYEVSLVLKGANPGAVIEHVMQHSAYGTFESDDQAIINTGIEQDLLHADIESEEENDMDMTVGDVLDTLTQEEMDVLNIALEEGQDALTPEQQEIINGLSDDQIEAVNIYAQAIEDEESEEDDSEDYDDEEYEDEEEYEEDNSDYEEIDDNIDHSFDYQGDDTLKHNAFNSGAGYQEDVLTHTDVDVMVQAAVEGKASSLASVLQANGVEVDLQHGLTNIDILFPQPVENKGIQVYNPSALNVDKIMGSFFKTPMSRIKNIFADITEETARARGYIKGNEKLDSIEALFFRETTPGTVIRRTKIDRDDILDIQEKGIDVVAFLQKVQQAKLQEEIVRAAFLGDGRPLMKDGSPNPDKISELHIRPIVKDDDLFTIKVKTQNFATLVDSVVSALPAYQGSGSPSLFINPFDLAKLKTQKDQNGRYLYAPSMDNNQVPNNANIAAYFMCKEVVEYRELPIGTMIIGNLSDYAFGVGKGGQVASFNQFDIDFNQEKYLIETRLSGAIQTPKSFIVVTVEEPGDADLSSLEFSSKGLRKDPSFTTNSDPNEKPGARYASKHGAVTTTTATEDGGAEADAEEESPRV